MSGSAAAPVEGDKDWKDKNGKSPVFQAVEFGHSRCGNAPASPALRISMYLLSPSTQRAPLVVRPRLLHSSSAAVWLGSAPLLSSRNWSGTSANPVRRWYDTAAAVAARLCFSLGGKSGCDT